MKRSLIVGMSLLVAVSLFPLVGQARPGGKGGPPLRGGDRPERPRPERVHPDTDGNGLISESEMEAAIERMANKMREGFKRRNERVVERFDADGDGELTGEELEKAKAVTERLRERRMKRRQKRNPEN